MLALVITQIALENVHTPPKTCIPSRFPIDKVHTSEVENVHRGYARFQDLQSADSTASRTLLQEPNTKSGAQAPRNSWHHDVDGQQGAEKWRAPSVATALRTSPHGLLRANARLALASRGQLCAFTGVARSHKQITAQQRRRLRRIESTPPASSTSD